MAGVMLLSTSPQKIYATEASPDTEVSTEAEAVSETESEIEISTEAVASEDTEAAISEEPTTLEEAVSSEEVATEVTEDQPTETSEVVDTTEVDATTEAEVSTDATEEVTEASEEETAEEWEELEETVDEGYDMNTVEGIIKYHQDYDPVITDYNTMSDSAFMGKYCSTKENMVRNYFFLFVESCGFSFAKANDILRGLFGKPYLMASMYGDPGSNTTADSYVFSDGKTTWASWMKFLDDSSYNFWKGEYGKSGLNTTGPWYCANYVASFLDKGPTSLKGKLSAASGYNWSSCGEGVKKFLDNEGEKYDWEYVGVYYLFTTFENKHGLDPGWCKDRNHWSKDEDKGVYVIGKSGEKLYVAANIALLQQDYSKHVKPGDVLFFGKVKTGYHSHDHAAIAGNMTNPYQYYWKPAGKKVNATQKADGPAIWNASSTSNGASQRTLQNYLCSNAGNEKKPVYVTIYRWSPEEPGEETVQISVKKKPSNATIAGANPDDYDLSGAKYTLYDAKKNADDTLTYTNKSKPVQTITVSGDETQATGKFLNDTITYTVGEAFTKYYIVEETAAAKNYEIDTTRYYVTFHVSADNKKSMYWGILDASGKRTQKGTICKDKAITTENKLNKATVQSIETINSGSITLKKIIDPAIATKAAANPGAYDITGAVYTVYYGGSKNWDISEQIKDEDSIPTGSPLYGQVLLTVKDYGGADRQVVEIGSFEIKDGTTGDGVVKSNIFKDANVGAKTMSDLPFGQYIIVETSKPQGPMLKLDPTHYTFELKKTNQTQAIVSTETESPTYFYIHKTSGNINCSEISTNSSGIVTYNNPLYSLAGAVFHLERFNKTTMVWEDVTGPLITDANGNTPVKELAAETYRLYEDKSSKGHLKMTNTYQIVTILTTNTESNPAVFSVSEPVKGDPLNLIIEKQSEEASNKDMSGAVFQIDYYTDYYSDPTTIPVAAHRTWYISPKYNNVSKKYEATLDAEHLASGYTSSAFYAFDSNGNMNFPLGTVTMKEIKAAEGFDKDAGTMTDSLGAITSKVFIAQIWGIDTAGNPVTNGLNTVNTDMFIAHTDTGVNYVNGSGQTINVFNTPFGGGTVTQTLTATNPAKRGDLEITKTDHKTGKTMANVFFKITAPSGEVHYVKTNANGKYNTKTAQNTNNTNIYDRLFDTDPNNDETTGGDWIGDVDDCGIWFYGVADSSKWEITDVKDALGVFPCVDGDYTIEEVEVSNPTTGENAVKDKQLMAPVNFKAQDKTVITKSFANVPEPSIHTLEWDTTTHTHATLTKDGELASVTDTVTYEYLKGTTQYTIKGILMELDDDGKLVGPLKDADGKNIQARTIFTTGPADAGEGFVQTGTVDVIYNFKGDGLKGKKFVIFEYLFDGSSDTDLTVKADNTIDETGVKATRQGAAIKHSDETDRDQIGLFPSIKTKAWYLDKTVNSEAVGTTMAVTDTVEYDGLFVGQDYRLEAEIHYIDKTDGTEKVLKGVDGKDIKATKTFTTTATKGSVDVPFAAFDATDALLNEDGTNKADKIVVFEKLYLANTLYAVHEDINDADQTITLLPRQIKTKAWNQDKDLKLAAISKDMKITDTVDYEGLVPEQEYKLEATIHYIDKADGTEKVLKGADGKEVKAEKTFKPEKGTGTVDVEFPEFDATVDLLNADGTQKAEAIVVYERLYSGNKLYATHEAIDDADQTIKLSTIHTTAKDGKTGEHIGEAESTATIVDTVQYTNLIVGKEYTVKGELKVTNIEPGAVTNYKVGDNLLDANGNKITAETTFTAEQANGSVDVTFTFDASLLAGMSTVVFEDIYHKGIKVGSHADLNDKEQTVVYPKIKTTLRDSKTGIKNIIYNNNAVLTDTITYWNLIPGKEYVVMGALMNKRTKKQLEGVPVVAQTTFTPTSENGTVDVVFNFDLTKAGVVNEDGSYDNIVAYEQLRIKTGVGDESRSVARHEDINDVDQTVGIPSGKTTALGKDSLSHAVQAKKDVKIVDTISYRGLIPGISYTATGTIMIKPDKKGEEPKALTDADGNPVTKTVTFVPTEATGTVDVEFTLDASKLQKKKIVVFEDVKYGEISVFVHADIDDEGQTVKFPKIGTTATDDKDGDHEIHGNKVVLVDTIKYENLVPGEKYKVLGTLMDKKTGKPAKDKNGEKIVTEATFTPEKENGETEAVFKFSTEGLEGKDYVVFEEVRVNKTDVTVATHEDIDDKDQTVSVPDTPTPPATPPTPKTGDIGFSLELLFGLGFLLFAAAIFFFIKRRKLAK